MLKFYLFIISLFFSLDIFSQAVRLDSLEKAQQLKYELKIAEKRKERMILFNQLPIDSAEAIDLRDLEIENIPDLREFIGLKELDLNGNEISNFRSKKVYNDNLTDLDLSNNPLRKIKFSRTDSLQVLKLNDCQLTKIPRSIRKLKGLKRLELNKNQISKIPGFIKRMKNLEEININFNGMIVSERDFSKITHVEVIQFIGNDIVDLPSNMGDLKGARKLNFSQNKLNTLPESIAELDSLESIIFYKNEFEEIPNVVFDLSALTELDFYYNKLKVIPADIIKLTSLELLFFSYNNIDEIPESMRDLDHLQKLYIHHNNLVGLPPWIVEFKNLEVLDVGYNKLAVLPDLSPLQTLKEVDVQENNLSEIPWAVLRLPSLERVFIRDNPYELTEEEAVEFKNLIEGLLEKDVRVSF